MSKYDHHFIKVAQLYSELSHTTRKKVGAVIVKNNSIISDGYNGTPVSSESNDCEDANGTTHWYVLHAEANAITKIAKSTNSCDGASLYITLSPCKECSKLILQSGIKRVIYKDKYRDISGIDFLGKYNIECIQIDE